MNITSNRQARRQRGFTLVEMIGVLAIIAVLAGMLVPRVFSAINDSRINTAVMSYNSVKSAAMLYFGKYGRFGGVGGAAALTSAETNNWDKSVLMAEGLVEKPFQIKIGTAAKISVVPTVAASTAADETNFSFNFDGSNTAPSIENEASGGQYVLVCVIDGVANDDAAALNKAVDGTDAVLGEYATGKDKSGRCKYDVSAGTGTVTIYIAHK